MSRAALPLVLFAIVVAGALLYGGAFVYFGNRAIGQHYARRAAALAPQIEAEGIRFAEDGVRARGFWRALFAIGLRWSWMDVRVTSRGLYLFQYQMLFGWRQAQPVLATPWRSGPFPPPMAQQLSLVTLTAPPRIEKRRVVLEGKLGMQRFTLRLELRAPEGFLRALG